MLTVFIVLAAVALVALIATWGWVVWGMTSDNGPRLSDSHYSTRPSWPGNQS